MTPVFRWTLLVHRKSNQCISNHNSFCKITSFVVENISIVFADKTKLFRYELVYLVLLQFQHIQNCSWFVPEINLFSCATVAIIPHFDILYKCTINDITTECLRYNRDARISLKYTFFKIILQLHIIKKW